MARPASEATVAIRNLLKERKGNITYSEAKPLLEKHGVSEQKFNVTKFLWNQQRQGKSTGTKTKAKKGSKKAKVVKTKRTTGKVLPPPKHRPNVAAAAALSGDLAAAVKFIKDNGGLAVVKSHVAAFEQLSESVRQAS